MQHYLLPFCFTPVGIAEVPMRLDELSESTERTICAIMFFCAAMNSAALYSPRSMHLSRFSHIPVSLALLSKSSFINPMSDTPASVARRLLRSRLI